MADTRCDGCNGTGWWLKLVGPGSGEWCICEYCCGTGKIEQEVEEPESYLTYPDPDLQIKLVREE